MSRSITNVGWVLLLASALPLCVGCDGDAAVATDPCEDVSCDTPPSAACNGDSLRTYDGSGTCLQGECDYGFTDTVCPLGCAAGACETGATVDCTLNPYEQVDWATFGQYKASFHTHTTESDGNQTPTEVIDEYHSADYDILAITDHNHSTWPWSDYGRDPTALGMLAVKGDEYSSSHHMNAFWDFTTVSSDLESGIPHVHESGGLSHINHPGRYNGPGDWAWYIPWYQDYDSCVGLEVFNQGDRYSDDRALWDNINENYFESDGRLVWGYSNDDKHTTGHLYRNFQFMLLPELTEAALRAAQLTGAFYFCYEPGGSGTADVPRITDIDVNNTAKTITITATGDASITWIGPGGLAESSGEVFDFTDYVDAPFVRAVLDGDNGDCYTQPFGFETTP